MADGVRVQPELLRDGADFPMFGVEPVTDLYAQFTVEHAHLRKIRGNGSTKRPRRPQRTQRSKPWCRCRAPFPWACRFRIGSAPRSGILPAEESVGEDTDRKSTRLNSSHGYISYAVFCLKQKRHV